MDFTVLLQAAGGAQPGGGNMMLYMMIGMIVIMYFFMIRPQQKKAKEAKKFQDSIAMSEKVVTTSGIHGRVVRVNPDGTVVIEIGRNVEITIERAAISMELTTALQKKNAAVAPVATNTKVEAETKA